jgi:BatD DUF11 like domain
VVWPGGFASEDPSAKEQIDKTVFPLSGSKTFDYSFVPNKKGRYELAPVEFSYFDPASSSYKTIRSEPIPLQVDAPKKRPARATPVPASHQDAADMPMLLSRLGHFAQEHLEWPVAALLLLGLAFFLFLRSIRVRRQSQMARSFRERAAAIVVQQPEPVIVADPLQKAKQFLLVGSYGAFYGELNRTIWSALSDCLGMPASALNKQTSLSLLRSRGWDASTTQLLSDLLYACEMSLYTPSYDTLNMEQLLEQTAQFLQQLARKPQSVNL